MTCKKFSPLATWAWNAVVVLFTFLVIDFIVYGLIIKGPNPYMADFVQKFWFTLFLAIAYAHIYNKASRIWRPVPKYVYDQQFDALGFKDEGLKFGEAFVCKEALKNMPKSDWCKASWPKIANGIVFNLFLGVIILFSVALFEVIMSTIFVYFLDGIRGGLITEEDKDAAILTGQLVLAGVVLEGVGKTEDDPR